MPSIEVKSWMTERSAYKAQFVTETFGHEHTGYVLTHPETGQKCIVDYSACRWIKGADFGRLMHEQNPTLFTEGKDLRDALKAALVRRGIAKDAEYSVEQLVILANKL